MKRLAIHILIVLILCGVFCDGYFTISQLSCGRVWLSDSEVYAADGWEPVTRDDLVTAFQYYCKSRNLTIDGSIADALTSFTTTTFNNICNTLGIDVNSLQANLKKTVEGNLGLRFLMNQQGVLAYNRIFAEFLQNNNLQIGDSVDNKVIKSGKYYTDSDGNGCFVYVVDSTIASDTSYFLDKLYQRGTPYKYNWEELRNMAIPTTLNFNLNNSITSLNLNGSTLNSDSGVTFEKPFNVRILSNKSVDNFRNVISLNGYYYYKGVPAIIDGNGTYLLFAVFIDVYEFRNTGYFKNNMSISDATDHQFIVSTVKILNNTSLPEEEVTVNTANNTINNNNYNNNYTIIYNDGDYYEDDEEPNPTTPPDGGGGGGGGGDDSDQPSPSGPDLPDWNMPHGTGNIGSDGTFDFDIPFSLPDLNIDWSLKNIGNKFPFCIPSDIVSFYQVLVVEPEAPAIDAHIPLGSFYDWHFEADFSQYDNWARIIRIVEYVGFVITLIYFTVKLVKG